MKKLGLVGGMGPESTIPYYHDIVYGVQKKAGTNMFPKLTIESVDVFQVVKMCEAKEYDQLVEYLMKAIHNLEQSGADFIALSANTPHIVFDQLQKNSKLPLISIVEAACQEAQKRGYKKIGLIGTKFTMEQDFFKKPFKQKNIDIEIPSSEEIQYINQKLVTEIELGVLKEETTAGILQIVKRMKEQDHIEAIVLGCTELPLILNDNNCPVPCLDTMQIHIKKIIDTIIDD